MIDSFYTNWKYNWDELHTTAMYGVSKELIPLVKIPGVGKSRAEKLYKNGYVTTESIAKAGIDNLKRLVGEKVAQHIKEHCVSLHPGKNNVTDEPKIIHKGDKTYVRRRKNTH